MSSNTLQQDIKDFQACASLFTKTSPQVKPFSVVNLENHKKYKVKGSDKPKIVYKPAPHPKSYHKIKDEKLRDREWLRGVTKNIKKNKRAKLVEGGLIPRLYDDQVKRITNRIEYWEDKIRDLAFAGTFTQEMGAAFDKLKHYQQELKDL